MSLATGTKLGPYEVVDLIGAGGMGEVYRAKDTRLDRTVAIKVLLPQFSANAELKQRFEREARSISSLQHAHICTLFDVGEHEGASFLVMELLEGETLAARLARGPMPLPEIVKAATQIAEALQKAHRSGLVHRDLKPGNIMLTQSGAKLMDFGLAKPLAIAAASGTSPSAPMLSAAVTISSPSPQMSPLTTAGTIVGTIQYMSPEQIEGREADARSDIFALGAVLYEMAVGKRAFQGKSQITVASAILEKDPEPMRAAHPELPVGFERIVQTCLAKDPEERFQTAQDVKLQLRWVTEPAPATAAEERKRSETWKVGAIALVAIAALAAAYWALGKRGEQPSLHVVVAAPEKVSFDASGDFGGTPVLSPNGQYLAFSAHSLNSSKALWVRPLNSFTAQRLEGTDGAAHPFWSPDSRYVGFFSNGKLNKVLATGGPVVALADAGNPRGGSWCRNDTILFTPDFQTPIMQVSASGGPATPATVMDASKHTTHRWPWCLPDGKHFLYLATSHQAGKAEDNGIYYASLADKQTRLIMVTDAGGLYASGYLLFHAQTSLMAQPFDPSSGKLSGEPVAALDKVRYDSGVWRMLFTVSENGLMGYLPGGAGANGTELVFYDRAGRVLKVVGEHGTYSDARISPDSKRLAFVSGDPNWEVWTLDLERGTKSRVTFDQTVKAQPTWSPDGRTLAYAVTTVTSAGFAEIHAKPASGTGADVTLAAEAKGGFLFPQYTSDGQYIVYRWGQGGRGLALRARPLTGDAPAIDVVKAADSRTSLTDFRVSPNGRWIAYQSNESGINEVYIAPFPRGDGKWLVSTGGADYPAWRGDSRELFFLTNASDVMAATVEEKNGELQIGTPQTLFHANTTAVGTAFDADPSGQRFLVNRAEEEAPTALNVVSNWTTEVRKK